MGCGLTIPGLKYVWYNQAVPEWLPGLYGGRYQIKGLVFILLSGGQK